MKTPTTPKQLALITATVVLATTLQGAGAISVDGSRDPAEYGPALSVQSTPTTWGNDNFLANFHAVRSAAGTINLFIGGKVSWGNTILLFIDSKPGGRAFIPNDLITSGGEIEQINNLGSSPSSGLTFENGFEPDYAIRIYGNGSDAHANLFNFASRSRTYLGNSGTAMIGGGPVSSMRTVWADLAGPVADHASGVEMALNMGLLGIPATGNQVVRFMAVMATMNSDYGSNQMLASRTSTTTDIGNGTNGTVGFTNLNLETEPGVQTIELLIDGSDYDADGIPNVDDQDDDNDGLPDSVEAGIGTNPLRADTDGDELSDGAEVNTHGTSPLLSDTDSDGLDDRVEIETHHCNPLLKDSDSDGFDDLFEVTTGFNPSSATSTPDALSSIRTAVEFRFNAAAGTSYRIESSTDMVTWEVVEPAVIGQGAVVVRFYSIDGLPKRFFRAIRN